jgi:hypothetical protein
MEVALLFSLSCWWFSAIFPGLWRQNEATEVVDVFFKQLKTIRRAWLAAGMLKITSVALCYTHIISIFFRVCPAMVYA